MLKSVITLTDIEGFLIHKIFIVKTDNNVYVVFSLVCIIHVLFMNILLIPPFYGLMDQLKKKDGDTSFKT